MTDRFPHKRLVDVHSGRVVRLTRHARERMAEMDADPTDVLRAALQPHSWYRGSQASEHSRVQRRDDSDIAIAYDPTNSTVISVLWATTDDYTRPEKESTA